jgi:hypothetical protein
MFVAKEFTAEIMYQFENNMFVPLTSALLNLPKGKSLGRSKPATNS